MGRAREHRQRRHRRRQPRGHQHGHRPRHHGRLDLPDDHPRRRLGAADEPARRRGDDPGPPNVEHRARAAVFQAVDLPGADVRAGAAERHDQRHDQRRPPRRHAGHRPATAEAERADDHRHRRYGVPPAVRDRRDLAVAGLQQPLRGQRHERLHLRRHGGGRGGLSPGPRRPHRRLRLPRQRVPAGHRGLRGEPMGLRLGHLAG